MTQLDNYLGHIQGEELQEGAWGEIIFPLALIGAYLGFIIWLIMDENQKTPKHPKWRKIWEDYEKMFDACARHFPDSHTKVRAGAKGKESEADITYEHYEQNPQRVKCQLTAKANTLKKFIKWVSKEKPEEVCKYNQKNQYKCIYYVNRVKEAAIEELRVVMRTLKMSNPNNMMTKAQFNKVTKVLGFQKPKKLWKR